MSRKNECSGSAKTPTRNSGGVKAREVDFVLAHGTMTSGAKEPREQR